MTLPFDQTLGLSHPFSVGKNVHSILGNPNSAGTFYADIAARDADTDFQVIENVGKAVGITSPLSIFVLMSTGPAVWVELGTGDPIDTFLELTDVFESTYTGKAGSLPTVNPGETGLSFNPLVLLDELGELSGLTKLIVGDIQITGNTISSLQTNQDITLAPNGGGTTFTQNDIAIQNANFSVFGSPGAAFIFDLKMSSDFISHIDHHNSSDFALQQVASGNTNLNAPTGSTIQFTINNAIVGNVDNTGFNFGNLRLSVNTISNESTNGSIFLDPNGTGAVLANNQMSIGALTAPAADTSLHLKSTTAALLFNNLDTTARDNIGVPLAGMGIWNTTTAQMENFDGVAWVPMGGGDVSGPATNLDNSIPTWIGVNSKVLQDPGLLFVESGDFGVGISSSMDSFVHIFEGSAGSVSSFGSTLTIENNGDAGLSLLCPDANIHQILFGNPISAVHGGIFYSVANGFQFRNNVNQNKMCIEQNGFIGIGTTSPDSRLHVLAGASGSAVAPGGTTLTLETNTSNFINFQQPDAFGGGILFQYPTGGVRSAFSYGADDGWIWSTVNNTVKMKLDATGQLRIGDATAPTATLDVAGSHANSATGIADTNHTVNDLDYLLAITSITAARIIDFPTTEIAKVGKEWPIKDESGSVDGVNTVTLTTGGSETIDGASSLVLNTPFFDLLIYTDGSNLFVRSA